MATTANVAATRANIGSVIPVREDHAMRALFPPTAKIIS
jgi:hypothetical protein